MGTDLEWEKWGQQDPYFGVITLDRFRSDKLNEHTLAEFFHSGQVHVNVVLQVCRSFIDPDFAPRQILDFGCGVGRLLIPFAAIAERVVGVDVSPTMLGEAAKNCAERSLTNVELVASDDDLSQVQGQFDLVHSAITLQHIDVMRGRNLFQRLIEHITPGGIGTLHLTYAKAYHPDSFGQPPPAAEPLSSRAGGLSRLLQLGQRVAEIAPPEAPAGRDPQMLMNPYNLNDLMFIMQRAGVTRFHTELTDHGGELGVFLYFRRPSQA